MTLSLVKELLNQSDLQGAEVACKKLLSKIPNDPEANFMMAHVLIRDNRRAEAVAHAETALASQPQNPQFMFLAARLYLDFRLVELAFPLLNKILLQVPTSRDAHWAMADYLVSIGKGDEAAAHYEQVLANLDAGKSRSVAVLDLAASKVLQGHTSEATPLLDSLLDDAYVAEDAIPLRAFIESGGSETGIGTTIQKLLAGENLSPLQRSDYLLALGCLYENEKKYNLAFEHWELSRAFRMGELTPANARAEGYEDIMSFYSKDLMHKLEPYGHASRVPIFVMGMPRSGTTLAEQIMASHSKVHGVGELARFGQIQRDFFMMHGADRLFDGLQKSAVNGELIARANETLNLFEVLAPRKFGRIVEKTPGNYRSAGYQKLCFPQAKFIHCRRHPADNFISIYQHRLDKRHDYSFDQATFAHEYVLQEQLVAHWRTIGINIFELNYEQLTADPEPTARGLFDYLELDWEPDCLKFYEQNRTVSTFSTLQVRKAISSSSVGRWKNYEQYLGPLFSKLDELNYSYKDGFKESQGK
jgi:tetratricopeptide (TPR) repeat protein